MTHKTLLAALLASTCIFPSRGYADFTVSGDNQITGQLGVGTVVPQARLDIRLTSADDYALKVSSQNGDVLLVVDKAGHAGIGLSSPQAGLDVHGSANSGEVGLLLRAGNSTSTFSSSQIIFAYGSSAAYRNSIRTRHTGGQDLGNAMDFFLWQSTSQPTALGDVRVLSLEASTANVHCSVHVHPAGDPVYELEVSSGGGLTGGGIIRYASAGAHSRRDLKTDISYLDAAEELAAYGDVKGLRHARFRYKTKDGKGRLAADAGMPLTTGLIYEDVPESIRGHGGVIVVDYRLMNMELALKEVSRRIEGLETLISTLEKKLGGKK